MQIYCLINSKNNFFYLKNKNLIFQDQNNLILFEYNYFNCFFSRINIYSGSGGIIYAKDCKTIMKLINCIFYNCFSTEWGGAIYFYCNLKGTNVKLNKICASNCSSKYVQFARIVTFSNSNNIYDLISINLCGNNPIGYTSLKIQIGNINFSNNNSSKNYNIAVSGISINHPTKLKSIFCTFINNYVSSNSIIFLESFDMHFLSFYNIINNNSPKDNSIIYVFQGEYIINNSILQNNTDILFSTYNGKLHVSNCIIIHHQNYIFKDEIHTFNNQINNFGIQTFFLIHFSTKYCNENYLNYQMTKNKLNYFKFNFLIFLVLIFLHFKFFFFQKK